jgi:hypothetical protein
LVIGLRVLITLLHYSVDSFLVCSVVVSVFQIAVCVEIARVVLASRRA